MTFAAQSNACTMYAHITITQLVNNALVSLLPILYHFQISSSTKSQVAVADATLLPAQDRKTRQRQSRLADILQPPIRLLTDNHHDRSTSRVPLAQGLIHVSCAARLGLSRRTLVAPGGTLLPLSYSIEKLSLLFNFAAQGCDNSG